MQLTLKRCIEEPLVFNKSIIELGVFVLVGSFPDCEIKIIKSIKVFGKIGKDEIGYVTKYRLKWDHIIEHLTRKKISVKKVW